MADGGWRMLHVRHPPSAIRHPLHTTSRRLLPTSVNPTALLSRALRGALSASAGRVAAVAACVVALLAFVPGATAAQGTAGAGVRVDNTAYLTYLDDAGQQRSDSA